MQSQTSKKDTNLSLEYSQLLIQLGIPQILIKKEINRRIPEVNKFCSTLDDANIRDKLKKLYTIEFTGTVCNSKWEIRLLHRFLKGIDLRLIPFKNKEKGYEIISNDTESIEDIRAIINTGDQIKIQENFIKRYNHEKLVFRKKTIERKATNERKATKSGVYKIHCIPTGDSYIGSSSRINSRLYSHKYTLNSDKHNHVNRELQALWNEHGESNFEFSVLEYTADYKEREKFFIRSLQPSINIMLVDANSFLRIKVTPEIKGCLQALSNKFGKGINNFILHLLAKTLKEPEQVFNLPRTSGNPSKKSYQANTTQTFTEEKPIDLPLEYCRLLIELGMPNILTKKEINCKTPEVKYFFSKLCQRHIRGRFKTLLNAKFPKKPSVSRSGIGRLNLFLKSLDLQAKCVKKHRDANKDGAFTEYQIISQSPESLENIISIINSGEEDKIMALFLKIYNPKNIAFGNTSGVYKIHCIPTGDYYIGSSSRINSRLSKHKNTLNSDKHNHDNRELQALWNEHGESNFEFSVLEYTADYKEREKFFIRSLQPSLNTMLVDTTAYLRIKFKPEIHEGLQSLSNRSGMKLSDLVSKLLVNELKRLES